MSKTWVAERPSNIALIKYMGKKDVEKNIPSNASISWTLDHLVTKVELVELAGEEDQWEALPSDFPFEMSATGRTKYLNHVQRMKDFFAIQGSFKVRSANNFPADCGIASSASSFAALTEVCCQAFSEISGKDISTLEKAMLSARGSGSSCRSFMSGLVRWDETGVEVVESELNQLLHMAVIVGGGAKKVSSSEAHKRVPSSLLFEGRPARSEKRLQDLEVQIAPLQWKKLYETVWAEFWDMHALFETSVPSFGYYHPGTLQVLEKTRNFWQEQGDGPLVTMDAGPNIHLLWRKDQTELAQSFFRDQLQGQWSCLSNIAGIGFAQV